MTTATLLNGSDVAEAKLLDPALVRTDFPILSTTVHGRPLVYLDNGATTQKPQAVINAVANFYRSQNANIHRGVYRLSQDATAAYEAARTTVAEFIHAAEDREVIFTRGTTESINLVASSWGRTNLKPGDVVLVSEMEHHSNIVPWQMIAEATGATVRPIPITDAGELRYDVLEQQLAEGRVRMVAVTHLSNSLGTINDVQRVVRLAKAAGSATLIDGAQWIAHGPTDVQLIGCDFYVFSGHKLYGPTGIGVLWGRREMLEAMPPYQGGGDMIENVSFDGTTYAGLPNKFEAGTPNIAGAVGLAAAIEYVRGIGFDAIVAHENALLRHGTARLTKIAGLKIIGTAAEKGCLISFVLEDPPIGSLDIGTALDRQGIAVRTGHHCCQPTMQRMHIASTTRASFGMYNTIAEIDSLADALYEIVDAAGRKKISPASKAIAYPKAAARTPAAAADELTEEFDLLGDRDARSAYVIDLGDRLPKTFELLKTVTTRVPGCMSEVYLVARPVNGAADHLEFLADANADIVRGLIAVLQRLFSGQSASDVLAFDVESFFARVGLDEFISMQRRNGLAGMIARLRREAATISTSQSHSEPVPSGV